MKKIVKLDRVMHNVNAQNFIPMHYLFQSNFQCVTNKFVKLLKVPVCGHHLRSHQGYEKSI